MKKIAIRAVGAIAILGALAIVLFSPWVQIEDVSRKDIRACRKQLITDLEIVQDALLGALEVDAFKEDLKDNDLPGTKGAIKKCFREVEGIVEELVNEEISFGELIMVSAKAPGYIRDTENFLDTSYAAAIVFAPIYYTNYEIVQETIDAVADYEYVFYLIVGFFVLLSLLGLAAAITHVLHKAVALKYIFMLLMVILAVAVCVGMPLLTDVLQDSFALAPELEDMALQATMAPYAAAVLAIVPVVLDIIFERKKKKEMEA